MKNKVQLITYADSLGGNLNKLNTVLNGTMKDLFMGGVHILPPFPSSGDRGFAPVDYFDIDSRFGSWDDIDRISETHDVVIDLMANHISRQSEFFQDFSKNGDNSKYKDLFITLDKIWDQGIPVQQDIDKIFLRRELPYSEYETTSHGKVKLWTTFGKSDPSEQIDVDIYSDAAKELFRDILENFSRHGVKIVRLDAVGYVIKKPGTSCFFVEPEIYSFLEWISTTANEYGLALLPEVHSHYSIQYKLAAKGYWIYDFILPYRILESIIFRKTEMLGDYLRTRPAKQFTMLDCHDGLPVIPDMNDLIDVESARQIVDICLERGSNLSKIYSRSHQQEGGFDVHQIRGTIYSMLGENDDDYIIARAIQLFAPGIPQVYYVGLLAGTNKYERAEETGDGREINRYNYSVDEIEHEVKRDVVQRLFWLIRFRNEHSSFDGVFLVVKASGSELVLRWENKSHMSQLTVDLAKRETYIEFSEDGSINNLMI